LQEFLFGSFHWHGLALQIFVVVIRYLVEVDARNPTVEYISHQTLDFLTLYKLVNKTFYIFSVYPLPPVSL
jgi:hypothetical protein